MSDWPIKLKLKKLKLLQCDQADSVNWDDVASGRLNNV